MAGGSNDLGQVLNKRVQVLAARHLPANLALVSSVSD